MLFGHNDKIKAFQKLVREDALSHAYLFYGDSQIGKCMFAKQFVSFLESGVFEVTERPLLDAKIVAPREGGVIGIEEIREVKKFLSQRPFLSPRRTVIFDGAHALTREAQGAMLKIVEEPPASTLIIFIATDGQVLFAPLLSRVMRVYFPRFSEEVIEEFLVTQYNISKSEAKKIARISFGRIGRALESLKNNTSFVLEGDLLTAIREKIIFLYLKDVHTHSALIEKLLDRKIKLIQFNLNATLQQKAFEALLS